ncbi:MAG: phytanoyl-CoA dioxygenase family protein [Alphaproteobacteria bacterium]|nr:phytanoyl-CoA dioxygenase family protein [Alphaproteobacteria bacterium]
MVTPHVSASWLARRGDLHALFDAGSSYAGNASVLERVGYPHEVWTEARMASAWMTSTWARSPDAVNHVYVHVPFCKSICHFCNYKRLRPGSADLMQRWLDRVLASLAVMGPATDGVTFHSLYFGGGTPSLLPRPMLEQLLAAIDDTLTFHPHAGRAFEADPAVLDAGKLAVLARHGIQHVAMGVQTFDARVNVAHDRGNQGMELVAERARQIRGAGIRGTSFDFLLGLHDTDPEAIFDDIDRALRDLSPRWVDVFFLTPTQRYVDLHFDGSFDAFWSHQRRFADVAADRLTAICRRHGYQLSGSDYDAYVLTRGAQGRFGSLPVIGPMVDRLARKVEHDPRLLGGVPRRMVQWIQARGDGVAASYAYTQLTAEQHLPLSLLGLGTGARSRVFGSAFVTCRDPGEDPEAAGTFEYVGGATDMAFEARAYLSDVLSDANRVPLSRLRTLFGVDVERLLPEAFAAWHQLGIARIEGDVLVMTPTDRADRYRALMWLLTDAQLEDELARVRRMDLSAQGLSALVAPFVPGAAVSTDWRLLTLEDGAIVLDTARGDTVRIRVAPKLTATHGVDLLPESRGAGTDLAKAVTRLKRAMAAHGADDLGITHVPVLTDTELSSAGQHEPMARTPGRPRRTQGDHVPAAVHTPEADAPRPLSDAQRAAFHRDGFVRPLPILLPAEVDRFRRWLEQVEAEESARRGGRWTQRDFDPDAQVDHPLLAWARELAAHPRLLDAVGSVLGPDLLVRNIDVFVREPRTGEGVAWHRDAPAVGPSTDGMLTAWLGLNPATRDNGCLQFAVGSHRTVLDGERLTKDTLTLPKALLPQLEGVALADDLLEPGQASLHHIRTLHRSGGNHTQGRRVGVVVRYAAATAPREVLDSGAAWLVRGTAPVRDDLLLRRAVPLTWVT